MAKPPLTLTRMEHTVDSLLTKVIEPVLCHLTSIPFSPAASQLLLGTAIHESKVKHRRQFGGGPARGLFQMEPATHDDIWDNYLKYRSKIGDQVKSLLTSATADRHNELEFNDNYAAAMCRVHYRRAPGALPAFDDIGAMAAYWKKHYNTVKGAGTVAKYTADWNALTKGLTLTYRKDCT